uniref:DEK n=1 Tax=Timema douglasi TaxID=61478 RepID=A0A7R8ZCS9_TIMDO|nr:unnamed protein product [Timema douglasi]
MLANEERQKSHKLRQFLPAILQRLGSLKMSVDRDSVKGEESKVEDVKKEELAADSKNGGDDKSSDDASEKGKKVPPKKRVTKTKEVKKEVKKEESKKRDKKHVNDDGGEGDDEDEAGDEIHAESGALKGSALSSFKSKMAALSDSGLNRHDSWIARRLDHRGTKPKDILDNIGQKCRHGTKPISPWFSSSDIVRVVPLLDQPLELQGTRDRKKVERFTQEVKLDSSAGAVIEIPEGRGDALGDIPIINAAIQRARVESLKPLHKVLFTKVGKINFIKNNLKKFNGFNFDSGSDQFEKKKVFISKLQVREIRFIMDVLDLEKKGNREELSKRMAEFLVCPKDSGKEAPKLRSKRSSAIKAAKRGFSESRPWSNSLSDSHPTRAGPGLTVSSDSNPPRAGPGLTFSPDSQPPRAGPGLAVSPDSHPPGAGPGLTVSPDSHPPRASPGLTVSPDSHPPRASPGLTVSPDSHPPRASPGLTVSPDSHPPGAGPGLTVSPDSHPPGAERTTLSLHTCTQGGVDTSEEEEERRAPRARRPRAKISMKEDSGSESEEKITKTSSSRRGKKEVAAQEEDKISEEENEKVENESEDMDSDEPKSKKKAKSTPNSKKSPAKKNTPAKKGGGGNKKAEKKSSVKKRKSDDKSGEQSSSEDEPLSKKSKTPPTSECETLTGLSAPNSVIISRHGVFKCLRLCRGVLPLVQDEEIKSYVKEILEGANLEEITMKTVCKQVYSNYPDFDLAHKKDFIKTTVKSVYLVRQKPAHRMQGGLLEKQSQE